MNKSINEYTVMVLIAVMTDWLLFVISMSNKNLKKIRRNGFCLTYMLILLCTLCEWAGMFLDGKVFFNAVELHYACKFVELTITPLIPFICAGTVFSTNLIPKPIEKQKLLFWTNVGIAISYFLICICLTYTKVVFYIDSNNVYHHAKLYNIYTIAFLLSGGYFFIKMLLFSRFHQNKNSLILIGILSFLVIGVSIQLFTPNLKTCWLTISIAATCVYIYYNDLTQYVDRLTQLLNQSSYLNRFETLHGSFYLVTFDIDDFTAVNNEYGHLKGNVVLEVVASVIREVYSKHGNCYRAGGDEFAVILSPKVDIDKLNTEFCLKLDKKRQEPDLSYLPYVSYGYSLYNMTEAKAIDMVKVQKEADKDLYINKEKSKATRAKNGIPTKLDTNVISEENSTEKDESAEHDCKTEAKINSESSTNPNAHKKEIVDTVTKAKA